MRPSGAAAMVPASHRRLGEDAVTGGRTIVVEDEVEVVFYEEDHDLADDDEQPEQKDEYDELGEEPEPEVEDEPLELEITTDSLQLFLKDIGKVDLLTAAQEVELAKRIERG